MIAIIKLEQLKFYAHHGVTSEERKIGGEYLVNVSMIVELDKSSYKDDKLDGTIDYSKIYDIIKNEMKISSNLLEHLAYRIKQAIITKYDKVKDTTICITKINPPMQADCKGATIEL